MYAAETRDKIKYLAVILRCLISDICCLNDVYLNADKKSRTLLLQLDLYAAFDTIDQSTLKSRLELNFGISGCALQWLSSYLSDRSQFVSVGGQRSQTMLCEFSVRQGSILGPLLFSLYVSPIANVIDRSGVKSLAVRRQHSAVHLSQGRESSLFAV